MSLLRKTPSQGLQLFSHVFRRTPRVNSCILFVPRWWRWALICLLMFRALAPSYRHSKCHDLGDLTCVENNTNATHKQKSIRPNEIDSIHNFFSPLVTFVYAYSSLNNAFINCFSLSVCESSIPHHCRRITILSHMSQIASSLQLFLTNFPSDLGSCVQINLTSCQGKNSDFPKYTSHSIPRKSHHRQRAYAHSSEDNNFYALEFFHISRHVEKITDKPGVRFMIHDTGDELSSHRRACSQG